MRRSRSPQEEVQPENRQQRLKVGLPEEIGRERRDGNREHRQSEADEDAECEGSRCPLLESLVFFGHDEGLPDPESGDRVEERGDGEGEADEPELRRREETREDRHRDQDEHSPAHVRAVSPEDAAQRPHGDSVGHPPGGLFSVTSPELHRASFTCARTSAGCNPVPIDL